MPRFVKHFAAATSLLLVASTSLAQTAQTRPYGDRVEVNMVLIDAVVTDADGNQILGLDKNDFIVRERGVQQAVESVDYYSSRRLLDTREENAPFKVERVHEERYFVFFLDKPEPGSAIASWLPLARRSLHRFIDEEMLEHDRVAIVGHDVRLKVYSDFTNDRKQLHRAVDETARFSVGLTKPSGDASAPSILRNVNATAMMGKSGTVYEAIDVLADALRPIRARKNLVIFSPGIIEHGDTIRNGVMMGESRYLAPAISSLHASNVTVYAINALINELSTPPAVHYALERFAGETSGRYFRNTTSFEVPLAQIEKATGGYYLLAYRPKAPAPRGFQKVDVSIRNPELRVKARAGYVVE